ncbi:DUF134 domain-containing protein [archaeon]|nr:DUF134 domain-containing protein [archaeon]
MSRPRKQRIVSTEPGVTYFKPRAVPLSELEEIILTVSELEALRLYDYQGLDQIDAAKEMKISQPTFHRLLKSGRNKTSDALSNGKAIKIEGGTYRLKKR